MGQKRLTIGRKAVAVAIIGDLLDVAAQRATDTAGREPSVHEVAEAIVALAGDVEYKPNADRLVIVLDASFEAPQGPDAARSTPEDQVGRQIATTEADQCAYMSNGHRCIYIDQHGGDHAPEPL